MVFGDFEFLINAIPLASPKLLSLGKKQINLLFRSLTRTFALKIPKCNEHVWQKDT